MPEPAVPFEFVPELLYPLGVRIKPMFGVFAVYIGKKIMLVLRRQTKAPEKNGVWVASSGDHHESLQKEIPALREFSVGPRGGSGSGWLLIPEHAADFEEAVTKVCDQIKKGDLRIGRIPKPRKGK